jgi:DNA-binding NarL/FixJ family response regulator
MSIRVLIADDQELVRTGFSMILGAAEGIEVVGEAIDGAHAVERAQRLSADVVLMDIRMPVLDGIQATRRLAELGVRTRVVILTTFDNDDYIHDALRAGASGFLLKDGPADQLIAAVRTVAAGESLLAPSITTRVIAELARRPHPTARPRELTELTARELEVLKLLARGLSNAEIAQYLTVGDATIKTHVGRLLMKLGLRDRVQAIIYAYETGLVEPGSKPGTTAGLRRRHQRHEMHRK